MIRTPHLIGLSLLAGIALGAVAVQGLHAQAKPPVYVVTEIETGQSANRDRSIEAAGEASKAFGGRILARTDKITGLDGTPPNRVIIRAFESQEKAQGWFNSPEQKKASDIRRQSTKSRSFIVEGLD